MGRRLIQIAVVFVVAIAAAQLIRPERTNPPIDQSRTIQAHLDGSSGANGLVSVLNRACGDCHSNDTRWPWYAQIAPVSWLMAYGVSSGRKAINFSDWASYPPERQRALLTASCNDASTGKMPGVYTLVRPETQLSASDIEMICAAARKSTQDTSR